MIVFKHERTSFTNDPDVSIEFTLHQDEDIHKIMQEFRRFLLAVSFQPGSIDEYIIGE